jgi:hypothetical protein
VLEKLLLIWNDRSWQHSFNKFCVILLEQLTLQYFSAFQNLTHNILFCKQKLFSGIAK